jgi:hypothetical protein
LVSLKEQKALSSLLILIIVLATVIVAVGAVAIYLWLSLGELISEEMEYSDFTSVDVSSAFEVEITQSSSYSVLITADEKIFDNIEVSKTGTTLSIGIEPGVVISVSTLKAEITMPNLVELVLSGASKGTIEGFSSSESFVVELSGASHLEMQDINVGNTDIALSGASTLIAEGSGNNLISIIGGASNLNLTNFPVTNSDLTVSGASQATVKLDGTLDAIVSGASTLHYIGDPIMGDIDISGGSTINKK